MAKTKASKGKTPQNIALESDQQKDFNRKLQGLKNKDGSSTGSGVIYIGHIPHGFYEQQMKGYFSQFGKVRRLRISRSKRTGGSKGYGFIQFTDDNVARIVADCMDRYLMFDKLLQCKYVPLTRLHPQTFKGANRKHFEPTAYKLAREQHNREKTIETLEDNKRKQKERSAKSLSKLAELGIDFEYPGFVKVEGVKDEEVAKDVTMEEGDSAEEAEPTDEVADDVKEDATMEEGDSTEEDAEPADDTTISKAAMSFLLEDSDEDEIVFPRTPPGARRKSLSDLKSTPNLKAKMTKPVTRTDSLKSKKLMMKAGTKRKQKSKLVPAIKRKSK